MDKLAFDLRQIRALVSVIDTGSFSAAAKQLSQTQSAVSQLIQHLESSLSCQLLDRRKRPVQATLAGRELYEFGVHILSESRQVQDWIHAIEKGTIPRLRLGLVDSVVQVVGAELLKYIQPQVNQICQVTGTAPDLLASLQAGKVDVVITMTNHSIPESLSIYPLISEEYVIATPKIWPQQSIETLCKEYNYIAYTGWTPTGTQTKNWLQWRNFKPNIQFELDRADNVLAMVAAGHGWTLTTPMFLAYEPVLFTQINCIPLPLPGLTRHITVMCREGELNNFIDPFVKDIRQILLNSKIQEVIEHWPWMEGSCVEY